MPIYFNSEIKKWHLDLTKEENYNIALLIKYLEEKINTTCVFVDKNSKYNQIADLRVYNDDDFFHS